MGSNLTLIFTEDFGTGMTVNVLRLGGTLVWDSEIIHLQTVVEGVLLLTFAVDKLMNSGVSRVEGGARVLLDASEQV